MVERLLEWSLRNRFLVLTLALLLVGGGTWAMRGLPIDAVPDVTNVQVQVLTEAPGLSPVEVERFITYPLELQMTGLPGLAEIRSLSKFALSQITVVFDDNVDVYFARQLVVERILAAKERLPDGIEPVMAPVATGLGEVYQYYLEGPKANEPDPKVVEVELTDQRTLQDWVLRPLLKQTVSYRYHRAGALTGHGTGWVERIVVDEPGTSSFFTPLSICLNVDSFEHLEFETRPDQLIVYTLVQGDESVVLEFAPVSLEPSETHGPRQLEFDTSGFVQMELLNSDGREEE